MFAYQRIVNALQAEIASAKWKPGEAFPGVRDVCARFGVSHLTAVKALDCLKALHLVESRRGAGTFVSRKSRLVVFLSPAFGLASFFPSVRRAISEICQRNGITFEIREIDRTSRADFPTRLEAAARAIIARRPTGIIYLPSANVTPRQDFDGPPSRVDERILALFGKAKVPVVLFDSGIESEREECHDLVGIDNRAVGHKLGRHLLERGARRVLFVKWRSNSPNVRDRMEGLEATVRAAGKPFSSLMLTKSGVGDLRALFRSPKRPNAVVCSSDRVAVMVLNILKKAKVRVPQDVLVAGVDGIDLAEDADLTTIQQPYRELARAACEALVYRIAHPKALPRHVMVATTLVPRASTNSSS